RKSWSKTCDGRSCALGGKAQLSAKTHRREAIQSPARRVFASWRLTAQRAFAQSKGRPRFVEGVGGEELLEVLLEKILLAEPRQRLVVARDDRVDVFERRAERVVAEILVAQLEVEQREPVQRPRRLVEMVVHRAARLGAERGEELHLAEPVEALVDQLVGHLEQLAQLRGRDGGQAVAEAAADGEED